VRAFDGLNDFEGEILKVGIGAGATVGLAGPVELTVVVVTLAGLDPV